AFAACASPKSYTGLADGGHTFSVRAVDAAGNVGSAASATWTVDTTAPVVTLTEPVDGSSSSDPSPTLGGVAGTAPGDATTLSVAVFAGAVAWGLPVQVVTASVESGGQYAVDAAALADGTYTARAEQSDAAGNTGQSATTTFTVDSSAPDTTPPVVDLRTPADGSVSSVARPILSGLAGTKQGDLATVTVLVHAGSSTSGALLQTLSATRQEDGTFSVFADSLADGVYTAYARQSDAAGNTGSSATRTFTVDTTAPTVTIAADPTSPTSQTTASLAFTSDEPGSTFECRLDGAAFTACSSPAAYTGLADGSHVFAVRAIDRAGNVGPADGATWVVDTTAPQVSLTTPASGSSIGESTVTLAGAMGTASGDSDTVTVRIYAGTDTSGTAAQTLTGARRSDDTYSVKSSALAEGTYTARAEQRDAAGNTGLSQSRTFTRADPVMIGAGDIAGCESGDGDAQTAALLARYPNANVFTLGDNAYPNGQPSEYANCYDPTWGAAKARTRPIPGGHDLATVSGGALPGKGYVDYFGAQLAPFGATATDRLKLYYSYDVGSWHVVALNAGCYGDYAGCDPTAMEQWFRQDLAAHPGACTIAMWHDARWSSGVEHGNSTFTQGMWKIAYDNGVDLVLSGHDHDYERFAPQDAAGASDPQYGVREFVVGSGGYYHYDLGTLKPNSEAFNASDYGVLKLALHEGSYDWQFVHEDGGSFTDSGTGSCHGAPPPPTGNPTVRSTSSATANHPATSLTIPAPQGSVAGDLLLAVVSHQGGSIRNMTPPTGWTAVPRTDFYETTNARIHAWYRIAGAAEPASYKFTLTGGSGMAIAGGVAAIVGADPLAPVDASGGQVTGSQSSLLTAPSITTTAPNALLVYGGAVNQPLTFVEPSGMAEQWDVRTSGQYNIATEVAVAGLPSVGATGTRSALLSAKSKGVAILLAIRADG
ncbi:MAG: Ig-like domain-containing protein, partial [Solirubrobacteraceae bacterium]|nr:Ig-like domain-containing protein [Solirubrobacteraceae bacterium]